MSFFLNEFTADGTPFQSTGEDGTVMTFDTVEAAVEMAVWMLEGGVESLVDGEQPLVTVVGYTDRDEEIEVRRVDNIDGLVRIHTV